MIMNLLNLTFYRFHYAGLIAGEKKGGNLNASISRVPRTFAQDSRIYERIIETG